MKDLWLNFKAGLAPVLRFCFWMAVLALVVGGAGWLSQNHPRLAIITLIAVVVAIVIVITMIIGYHRRRGEW